MQNIRFVAAKAREVGHRLSLLSTEAKNEILLKIAEAIEENAPVILKANAKDISAGKRNKLSQGMLDRLLLTKDRLLAISTDVRKVAGMEDFVGKIIESRQLPNELYIKRVRVPLGVIGIIYEARPNVTVDAATLCLKSGNAVILKGGSDAINSNRALVKVIQNVLVDVSFGPINCLASPRLGLKEVSFLEPPARLQDAVQLIETADRNALKELLTLHDFIDVIIPRGGRNLINFVRENSRIPVIETGASTVHIYVHSDANIRKAVKIILNAKLRRVAICNTLDSLLIHQDIVAPLLKEFVSQLSINPYCATHLELRADQKSFDILRKFSKPKGFKLTIKKSCEKDYLTEFLDYILAIKTVKSLDEAIEHISIYSLKHSEAIITEDESVAQKFLKTVDAACVYWNASTQFSDGGQFGLGAEIGISTQKLHVRGPFALEGLTSYKWVVQGSGQIRT